MSTDGTDRTDAGTPDQSDRSAGSDADPATDPDGSGDGGRPCPHCGDPMYRRHCKYVCPNHGVVFDCSDPFW